MKRKWKVLIMAAALALLLSIVFARQDTIPDPIHNGKPVSEWVRACVEKPGNTFDPGEPEVVPVLEIGAEAVPFLIKVIEGRNGFRSSGFYNGLYKKSPALVRDHLPAAKDNEQIRIRGYWTLAALGPAARPAVPVLVEQFNTNNSLLDFVRYTLTELGPDAKEAIPVLTNAFHGPDGILRHDASLIRAKIYPDYPELLPTLLKDLRSTNFIDRRLASFALAEMGPAAKSSVPALKEALKDPDIWVQKRAAEALEKIGP